MIQIANDIISKINIEIEMFCIDNNHSSDKVLYMINFIKPLFEELREFIHQYTFQDTDEEIEFFKNTKPFILSKLIYFNDVYLLEIRKPNGSKEVLKEYYKKKQIAITEFCNANLTSTNIIVLKLLTWINTISLEDMKSISYATTVACSTKTLCFQLVATIGLPKC